MANVTRSTPPSESITSFHILQADALSYLLEAVEQRADVGFLPASSEPFVRIPGLCLEEDAVFVPSVTAQGTTHRVNELQDRVIPFNAIERQTGLAQTTFSLAMAPLLFDFGQRNSTLVRIKGHLLVAYVLPDCVGVVRYGQTRKLLTNDEPVARSQTVTSRSLTIGWATSRHLAHPDPPVACERFTQECTPIVD